MPANVARSCLQPDLSGKISQPQITRSALQIGISVRALDRLIARSAARAHRRIRWHGDLVVHRDIAHVHVVDMNSVSFLAQWRVLLNFADVALPPSEQPAVANVDLAANEN